jgi:hypothetical protein
LLLPLGLLRADPTQPNEGGLISGLITKAKEIMQPLDALVSDGGFPLEAILTVAVPRFVAKQARNFTARRPNTPGEAVLQRGGRLSAPWPGRTKAAWFRQQHLIAAKAGRRMR